MRGSGVCCRARPPPVPGLCRLPRAADALSQRLPRRRFRSPCPYDLESFGRTRSVAAGTAGSGAAFVPTESWRRMPSTLPALLEAAYYLFLCKNTLRKPNVGAARGVLAPLSQGLAVPRKAPRALRGPARCELHPCRLTRSGPGLVFAVRALHVLVPLSDNHRITSY